MAISDVDEYKTLRAEMMGLFERIHDTTKYGLGGFIALIAYQHNPLSLGRLDDGVALVLQLLLILVTGLVVINLYKQIYVQGTYLAVRYEKTPKGIRWHRMSRSYGEYLKNKEDQPSWIKKLFVHAIRWETDLWLFSLLVFITLVISWSEVIQKTECVKTLWEDHCLVIIGAVALTILVLFYVLRPALCIRDFLANTESNWKQYVKDFGTEKFYDPYV